MLSSALGGIKAKFFLSVCVVPFRHQNGGVCCWVGGEIMCERKKEIGVGNDRVRQAGG